MPKNSYKEQLKIYKTAKNVQRMQQQYSITQAQAKRLAECGLSKQRLERLYEKAPEDFDRAVQTKGVRSKPLREKLFGHLFAQF